MNNDGQISEWKWFRMPSHVRDERVARFHEAVSQLCNNTEREYNANGCKPVEESDEYNRLNGVVNDLWPTVARHQHVIEYAVRLKIDEDQAE